MKLIHCSDLHLDSKMTANLTPEQSKQRREEILHTFIRMAEYAEEENVRAILIAGDLFDTGRVSAHARNAVYETILNHSGIDFYYIRGNHDTDGFLERLPEIPENLKLFGAEWTTYPLFEGENGSIVLTGAELDRNNSEKLDASLVLSPRNFNIVLLHGQLAEYPSGEKAEVISLSGLKNKSIHYLALGHIHEFRYGDLPPAGRWCYPGALEGRGFDECGEHGFVVLDINEEDHSMNAVFQPFAARLFHELRADISDCMTTLQIAERIESVITEDVSQDDLVKIVLTGETDFDCEKSEAALLQMFADRFFYLKIEDRSTYEVDYEEFADELSLKGEFVRLVGAQEELDDETKAEIIRCGIQALNGEEI